MDAAKEIATRDLNKAMRLARRLFHRRVFKAPVTRNLVYSHPKKIFKWDGEVLTCYNCGRPTAFGSRHCCECFQQQVREKYAAKVAAEHARVSANEEAFTLSVKEYNMSRTKQNLPASPITRSTAGLRTALFEEMEALRNGTSNAQRARSVAMMANSILQSVQVEIEYHKYVNANQGRITGQSKVVELGTNIELGEAA